MGVSEAIRRGWSVTWRCKYLWLLAFLAGVVTFDSSDITGGSPTFEAVESSGSYEELSSLDNLSPAAIGALILAFIGIVILFLFVGLLLWLLGKIAKAGLIHASAHLDDGQKVTLGESFKVGIKMLGRMVGTSLLLYGPLILLFLLMILIAGVIGFFGESGAAGSMSFGFISLICLLFVYIIAASLIQPFAERGIVLQDLGVFDGIRHGW